MSMMGEPQGREARGSAVVIIGGARYERFLSLTLKRSIEEAACSGQVVLSWPGAEAFGATMMAAPAFDAGVMGAIMLDGQLAGRVCFDTRISKCTPKHYELALQFRGVMAINVDSCPDHPSGQFNNQGPEQIIPQITKGGGVEIQGGGEPFERFIIAEGETIERAARRAARERGMHGPWETPQGNWVIQDKLGGKAGGGNLKAGRDFVQWSVKADCCPRMHEYKAYANQPPTDEKYGEQAEKIYAQEGRELNYEVGKKLLKILVDTHQSQGTLRKRAVYEADRRTAQGLNVTLIMSTWSDRGGKLWEVGGRYHVTIPVDGVDDTCILTEAEFELTSDSRRATLILSAESAWSGGSPEGVLNPQTVKSRLYDRSKQQPAESTQIPPPPMEVR